MGIFVIAAVSSISFAQTKPASPSAVQEFPVTMRQNITAGKTAVGTKVEAKLTIGTLVNGTVVPVDAIFSGEVIESAEKSSTAPCRLAVGFDTVRWKGGSTPIKVYLTAWYFPITLGSPNDLSSDASKGIHGEVGIQKTVTHQSGQSSSPFPSGPPDDGPDAPPVPGSNVSSHRVVMKGVVSKKAENGTVVITSSRFNIKIDKSTTYVLANGDLRSAK